MDREINRENVVKGLECCMSGQPEGLGCDRVPCPYCDFEDCEGMLHRDALALLKAQEPCEDWISRKRLKDEIQYYIDEAGWGEDVNKVLGWCMEFIDNQMAVKWE